MQSEYSRVVFGGSIIFHYLMAINHGGLIDYMREWQYGIDSHELMIRRQLRDLDLFTRLIFFHSSFDRAVSNLLLQHFGNWLYFER